MCLTPNGLFLTSPSTPTQPHTALAWISRVVTGQLLRNAASHAKIQMVELTQVSPLWPRVVASWLCYPGQRCLPGITALQLSQPSTPPRLRSVSLSNSRSCGCATRHPGRGRTMSMPASPSTPSHRLHYSHVSDESPRDPWLAASKIPQDCPFYSGGPLTVRWLATSPLSRRSSRRSPSRPSTGPSVCSPSAFTMRPSAITSSARTCRTLRPQP